ncbi:MAG TPA: type II secretion system protein GspG [Cellvibrionales bacterium]|mgnify:FL=1|jgi:general secretion pathway protein G|nr:type II secretion system major pseudopilin GspG [Pseudomonadales bacterium]HAB55535.1 type II secretion system protein GspG [Cellvibrionales bacterium]HAW14543.1 type II secretion system protein GspG [Cellvibrionales bacterium]HCX26494.1 type II secretion system protein GspG [Cellvibrionales bacterium]
MNFANGSQFAKNQQGFSLIEVLVVVVIMGMLIGLIGPNVLGQVDRARVTTAKADIATLSQALDMYKLDNHFYPTTDQGLEALVKKPQASPSPKNWNSQGYLKGSELPLDPWDNDYVYLSPGEGSEPYELMSLGADARVGGDGYASDISSWDR